MAHFALLWKARTIEKYRRKYENEKNNSILLSNAEIPDKTLSLRWKHYRHDISRHISRTFSKWYPEGTTFSNLLIHFKDDMKFPQILLRSLFGFIGGLILTYLCFVFFVFQLSLSLVNATVLSSIIGVVLTLGLTVSNRMRCLIFLLIPQLFSRVGRYTLTCYALVLILTGPATNTLKNLEVLSESMACSQVHIKTSYKHFDEAINKPYNSMKQSLDLMIRTMKEITYKLKMALIHINRIFITLSSLIQSTYSWLDSMTQYCNRVAGDPYEKCKMAILNNAQYYSYYKHNESLNRIIKDVADISCKYLSSYKSFCVPANYADETFVATMKGKLRNFTDRVSKLVYLQVHIQQSYSFIGNSRSDSQVTAGIVTEIRNRADPILTWLSWSSCVTSLFLLLIIFRAKHYQRMYESRSRFDNRFITKEFRELDLQRLREGKDTVLPLNKRERAKYVTTTSFRLVASEKLYINRSVIFMIITTFKLMIHIVADYSLYWVLMTIRYHGNRETPLKPGEPDIGIRVTGNGFVARFLRSVIEVLNIPLQFPTTTNKACLPNPHPSDYKRYTQIGILIVLLWFFALFEPYGLRLRHLIVGHYRPERAKARAQWLYNHILRTRASFMKLARRKLHREYKYSDARKLTFRYWIRHLPPAWLRWLFGIKDEKDQCVLCNTTEEPNDPNTELTRCQVKGCPGIYCVNCFTDMGQMCTICLSPLDYGDLSDVSMEKGSSDDSDDEGNFSQNMYNLTDISFNNIDSPADSSNESNSSNTAKEQQPLLDRNLNTQNNNLHIKNSEFETSSKRHDNSSNPNNPKSPKIGHKQVTNKKKIKTRFKRIACEAVYYNYVYATLYSRFMFRNLEKYRLFKALRIFKGGHKLFKTPKLNKRLAIECSKANDIKKSEVPTKKSNKKSGKHDKKKVKKKDINKEEDKNAKFKKDGTKKYKKRDKSPKENADGGKKKKDAKDKKKTSKRPNSIPKMHYMLNRYWQNMMLYLFPKRNSPSKSPSETSKKCKKKKRRKKPQVSKEKEILKENVDTKVDSAQSDNLRIHAYLSELDWIMGKNPGEEEKKVLSKKEKVPDMIQINDILIPKLKLDFSSESVYLEPSVVKSATVRASSSDSVLAKKKDFTREAIDRYLTEKYFARVSETSLEMKHDYQNGGKLEEKECPADNVEKPVKYFDLLGGKDFLEEMNINDYENIDVDYVGKLLASSSHSDDPDIHVKREERIQANESSLDDPTQLAVDQESAYCKIRNKSSRSHDEDNLNDEIKEATSKKSVDSQKTCSTFSSSKWSRLRRELSERLPCIDCPLTIVKGLYNALLKPSEVRICTRRTNLFRVTAEKGVMVCPRMCSCASQKNYYGSQENLSMPIQPRIDDYSDDSRVNFNRSTCTCATQYYTSNRTVGTFWNSCPNQDQDSSETTINSVTDSLISGFHSSTETESTMSLLSDNTTVYSLATIDYRDMRKKAKFKKNLFTKANRATSTNVTNCVDVSTVTEDWWSPMVEKKDLTSDITRYKKGGKRLRTTPPNRIVTFKSRTDIIPYARHHKDEDIMSASRFLLESQKHYNEVFASRFYKREQCISGSQIYTQTSNASRRIRRYRRTKRLGENYSPRKLTSKQKQRPMK